MSREDYPLVGTHAHVGHGPLAGGKYVLVDPGAQLEHGVGKHHVVVVVDFVVLVVEACVGTQRHVEHVPVGEGYGTSVTE